MFPNSFTSRYTCSRSSDRAVDSSRRYSLRVNSGCGSATASSLSTTWNSRAPIYSRYPFAATINWLIAAGVHPSCASFSRHCRSVPCRIAFPSSGSSRYSRFSLRR